MTGFKKMGLILIVLWTMGTIFSGAGTYRSLGLLPISPVFAEDPPNETANTSGNQEEGAEENPCPECPECPDPAKVVLRGLEEKRTMVDKQHKAMLEERKQLELFEEQIDEKLENLKTLEKQIKDEMALLEQKKSQRELDEEAAYEAQMRRLVKTYETMKPKAAAPIIDKMNLEVAQEIFLRMKEKAASDILSFVDSEKAAKISERLAFKEK